MVSIAQLPNMPDVPGSNSTALHIKVLARFLKIPSELSSRGFSNSITFQTDEVLYSGEDDNETKNTYS
jgi:hypothetical protein